MVFETKEQIIKRQRLARYHLRAIIRKAQLNAFWLRELEDVTLGENVAHNITIILNRSTEKRSVLTIHDKTILKKNASERTKDEKAQLVQLFDELPCFKDFNPVIREKLIDVVEFQYFGRDRMLIMEGHRALSMLFIITGEVALSKLLFDSAQNQVVNKAISILSSGEYFGHVGMIFNKKRNASATTKTDCELLCVYKEDFDEVLKETMKTRHEDIKSAIRRFEYFKNFTDEKITECCVLSKIDQFNPQQTIFSQVEITNFSYFVLSGKAMILQCLKIRKNMNGKSELVMAKKKISVVKMTVAKLPSVRENRIASIIEVDSNDVKHQFVDVGSYNVGGVFGIGEEMENRVIIARNVVQCLMIPRYWLFQKTQNVGNVWQRLKLFLNSSVPSQQKLFQNYLANQQWKKFKKKTIEDIKKQYGITASETQQYNIPVICRIEDC